MVVVVGIEAIDARDTTNPRKPAIIAKTVARAIRIIPEITYPAFNSSNFLEVSFH